MKNNVLALAGAAAGGVVGYLLYFWLLSYGLLASAVPGGLLGLGAGLPRNTSAAVAVVCGLAATALGLFAEFRSTRGNPSLAFFLTHIADLDWRILLLIA